MAQAQDEDYVHVKNEKIMNANEVLPVASSDPNLSFKAVEDWERKLLSDPKNRLALSALMQNDVRTIISQKVATLPDTQVFNIKIPFEGAPITNQRSSGRCWLFATTNVLRVPIMKHYNLKEFELSQAYLFYWDKLEKANWFLEQILQTIDEDLDSRIVQELLKAPVNDGGQWDMAANLVQKYGLVPQALYPDSFNAMNSSAMGSIITTKLRENALVLRSMQQKSAKGSSVRAAKLKMMQEIHGVLTLMLGPPPKPDEKMDWEYYDSNGKFHKVSIAPLEFSGALHAPSAVRASGIKVSEMFSLVNDPRNPYMRLLTVDRLGNVLGGNPVTYINVDMSTIKTAAINMLKAGIPVFFGSDVGKYSNSSSGIMDTALYDYDLAFNISLGMSKSQRLKTGESAMTHAMVLTAVHVENGKSVRWRVMNSWGEAAGSQGYFVMTDDWMDQFTYQIVVDPRYIPGAVKDILKQDPKHLPLWDPMGALA
jgi:bleomycin hydrolase